MLSARARRVWGAPLLVALIAVLLHLHAVRAGFLESDDWVMLHFGWSYSDPSEGFETGVEQPDVAGTLRLIGQPYLFTLLFQVFGYWAPGYRAFNLLTHAAVSVLVLILARRLLKREDLSLFAGLLFSCLPKSWDVTSMPSSVPWSLVTLLMLGSLILLAAYRAHLGRAVYVASFLLLLPGLVLREIAFLLPCLLVLDLGLARGFSFWRHARDWLHLLPHAATAATVAAVFALTEYSIKSAGDPVLDFSAFTDPLELLRIVFLVLPSSLFTLADPTRLPGWAPISAAWAAIAGCLVLAAVLTRRVPGRPGLFGLGFASIALLPLIVTAEPFARGPAHYYYLAAVGLALLIAWALAALDPWPRWQRSIAGSLVLVAAASTVAAQQEYFSRREPARALIEQLASLARLQPPGSMIMLLEGGPVDRDSLDAAILAAWLASPAGRLDLAILEGPRVCPVQASPPEDLEHAVVVYWWRDRFVQSDLGTAARLLKRLGCNRPPDPGETAVATLPGDQQGWALVGGIERYESFRAYVMLH